MVRNSFQGVILYHRGLLKLAFHDADMDTDTDSPNTASLIYVRHTLFPREEIGRKDV